MSEPAPWESSGFEKPRSQIVDVTPGGRCGAGLIDVIVVSILYVAYASLFGRVETDGGFSSSVTGVAALGWLVVAFGYFGVMESTLGATVGKLALGHRVVMADGSPLKPGPVAIRTAMRFVDGFPYLIPNLLGLIVLSSNQQHQRIGDLVAKTRVVTKR